MDTYPIRLEDAPTVIAGLEALAQEMRDQPSDNAEATLLLAEQAAAIDVLAEDLRDWLVRRVDGRTSS